MHFTSFLLKHKCFEKMGLILLSLHVCVPIIKWGETTRQGSLQITIRYEVSQILIKWWANIEFSLYLAAQPNGGSNTWSLDRLVYIYIYSQKVAKSILPGDKNMGLNIYNKKPIPCSFHKQTQEEYFGYLYAMHFNQNTKGYIYTYVVPILVLLHV